MKRIERLGAFSRVCRGAADAFCAAAKLTSLVFGTLGLVACGGGGGGGSSTTPPPATTYSAGSSVAQKGPLIQGSTVTAQELDASLTPTGKQYSYQITSNLGTFAPTSTFSSRYVGVAASGYYFDEIAATTSTGPITLNGYSDLATDSSLNVNLLTTLAYQRIQHLVTASGMTFANARSQAEREVLAALNIPTGEYSAFGALDLSGSSDGDQILAALSSVFDSPGSAGAVAQLVAAVQSDIGSNGTITSADTKTKLALFSETLVASNAAANLTREYSSVGKTFTAADISNWIDRDGDGVVGKYKFQVADATPSSVFTFPSFVTDAVKGTSIAVTAGQLAVNGTPVTGTAMIASGDVITLSPAVGSFPNGVLTAYLVSSSVKVARVSFSSGLVSIAITPADPSLPVGLTQQLNATGTFSDTSTADVSSMVTWNSSAPSVATVDTTSGVATGVAPGSTAITATSGSVSGSTTLTVTTARLQSISIEPNPSSTGVGISTHLRAIGTFPNGVTADVTNAATWASSGADVATVGQTTGLVSGVKAGSVTISATIGSFTGTTTLSVVVNGWGETASLITPQAQHTATLLLNGKVLVVGTRYNGPNAQIYDPVANKWTSIASPRYPRVGPTATLLSDGKVLVVGGRIQPPPMGSVPVLTDNGELYDPVAGTWTLTGDTPALEGQSATLLPNGTVLVVGRAVPDPYHYSLVGVAEIYNPTTATWSPTTGSPSQVHVYHTATLLANGKVLIAGGQNGAAAPVTPEIYDPASGTWAITGALVTQRELHTATLFSNGTVLLAGGTTLDGSTPLSTAEIYDPAAGTWTQTGSLTGARFNHTATLLPNGTVLVAGGKDPTYHELATAEIYDPVAATWTPTASMAVPRTYHAAVLLPNGTVMVVGGVIVSTSPATYLTDVEIYY